MSTNLNDFVIENGVLQGYLGRDEEIVIPDGVKAIEKWAFMDTFDKKNIKSIKISNSVKIIEDFAFQDCGSLRNLYIPASVEKIGKGICRASDTRGHLTNIEVDENNKYYSSLNGSLYSKDKTKLLQYAVGKEDSTFTIPDGVVSIEDSAFMGSNFLRTVKIPNSVVYIKDNAFRFCYNLLGEEKIISAIANVCKDSSVVYGYCERVLVPEIKKLVKTKHTVGQIREKMNEKHHQILVDEALCMFLSDLYSV